MTMPLDMALAYCAQWRADLLPLCMKADTLTEGKTSTMRCVDALDSVIAGIRAKGEVGPTAYVPIATEMLAQLGNGWSPPVRFILTRNDETAEVFLKMRTETFKYDGPSPSATTAALVAFWRDNRAELEQVSKPTLDALDHLIRQDAGAMIAAAAQKRMTSPIAEESTATGVTPA